MGKTEGSEKDSLSQALLKGGDADHIKHGLPSREGHLCCCCWLLRDLLNHEGWSLAHAHSYRYAHAQIREKGDGASQTRNILQMMHYFMEKGSDVIFGRGEGRFQLLLSRCQRGHPLIHGLG